MGALTFVS